MFLDRSLTSWPQADALAHRRASRNFRISFRIAAVSVQAARLRERLIVRQTTDVEFTLVGGMKSRPSVICLRLLTAIYSETRLAVVSSL